MIYARINLKRNIYGEYIYHLQIKKWWGWKTIYRTHLLSFCKDRLKDLESIWEVQFIRAAKL
jgi:hypothetical protein